MRNTRHTRTAVAALLAAVLALVAVGCTSTGDSTEDRSTNTTEGEAADTTTTTTEPVDPTAGETIALEPCPDDVPLECGTVTVPIDYTDESVGTLEIAVGIHRATSPDDRVGYLFVNPGGPGSSGVEYAAGASFGPGAAFTGEVIERFDIVGFDPRGVTASEPNFECGEPGQQLALLNQIDGLADTPEEIALGEQAAALCVESMGPAAALLGSESVARDMDEIRKALGAEQISYFGASYGSALGAWYATLFPDQVRAMVVDGADNPVDDLTTESARVESSLEEGRQFEILLNEALLACDSDECPIFNDGDPIGYYLDKVDDLDLVNEAFGGDKSAGPLAIITPLYDQATWPALWNGLAALDDGDAQPLIDQAAFQLGETVGTANFTGHVNCLDLWSLQPGYDRETQLGDGAAVDTAAADQLPLLSVLSLLTLAEPCPFYDTIIGPPLGQPLDGSNVPILVVGNPSDPATPFTESVELVDETLSNGYLLEVDHPSHVVFPSNSCANEVIHSVLFDLEFPAEPGVACALEEPDDSPTTAEEVIEILALICAASAVEETDPGDLETACVDFAERVQTAYDTDEITEALESTSDENAVADGIIEILETVFAENSITPNPEEEPTE